MEVEVEIGVGHGFGGMWCGGGGCTEGIEDLCLKDCHDD